eukprot:9479660-Pyramimonas_sp.AAC.1
MSSALSQHLMNPKLDLTMMICPSCFLAGGSFTTVTRTACFAPPTASLTMLNSTSAPTAAVRPPRPCTASGANRTVAVDAGPWVGRNGLFQIKFTGEKSRSVCLWPNEVE